MTFCKTLFSKSSILLGGLFIPAFVLFNGTQAQAGVCKDSKNAAQVARTAYNSKTSDKKKYIPSGYTYVKSWSKSGQHAYLTTTKYKGKTLCHYAFRGLSGNTFWKSVKNLGKLITSTTCKSSQNKNMGRCSKWVYESYKKIRSSVLSDLKKRKCTAGINIIGHSMGGAISALFAADLYLSNPGKYDAKKGFLKVYTFGSPRVFKKNNAKKYHGKIWTARWVYQGTGTFTDHVPSYPSSKSFSHYGQAYRVRKQLKFLKYKYSWGKKSQNWAPKSLSLTDHEASVYTKNINKAKKCK